MMFDFYENFSCSASMKNKKKLNTIKIYKKIEIL